VVTAGAGTVGVVIGGAGTVTAGVGVVGVVTAGAGAAGVVTAGAGAAGVVTAGVGAAGVVTAGVGAGVVTGGAGAGALGCVGVLELDGACARGMDSTGPVRPLTMTCARALGTVSFVGAGMAGGTAGFVESSITVRPR
jgi:hypothetical protein